MNESVTAAWPPRSVSADQALKASAALWYVVAVVGQWAFVAYVLSLYGGPTLLGEWEGWNRNTMLFGGHRAGDVAGNLVFAAHVSIAAIILVGGTLQLLPQIRAHALPFHRWSGRVYIASAVAMSLGGLYLVWVRGSTAGPAMSASISLNAVLILVCAAMALRCVLAGDVAAHRRWALRLFLMVSGVWFFRVGFMAWVILNQGPVGSTENMDGPFDRFWGFANYLLPLAMLELYLRTRAQGGAVGKWAMAAGLVVATVVMGVGIVGAWLFMWRPLL